MSLPRILQIIPSLDRAGAEKQLCLLAAGLPRDAFDVHVCALTRGGPYEKALGAAGIPLEIIGKAWRLDPLAWWRLKRHIARLRPTLVQTWLFAANAYGRSAALACGVPHVLANERCVDPWKGDLELWIDRRLSRRTERIVVNSTAVRQFYVARGLPAEKFVLIPNGVAPPAPSPRTRESLLAELGLSREVRLVGLVGRLWLQKRIKDAIWALDLLKVIRDDVHLLIFGDGPQRWWLEQFRDRVRIRDKVHFMGHRDDVADWLPHFDVFFSSSGYEGQSNAILEAMAAARPIVATDIPGTRDLVVPDTTGLLVPLGDRAAMAQAINRLLDDGELAARLGAAAQQRAANEFSVGRMVERYAALYGQVL